MISHSNTRVTITVPKEFNIILEELSKALNMNKSKLIITAVNLLALSLNEVLDKQDKMN